MKMIVAYVLIASVCFTVSFAQNYYITNPIGNTLFNGDEVNKITWINVNNPVLKDTIITRIELVDGDSNNARFVRFITEVPSNILSYDWKVPNDLPTKTDYFIKMGAKTRDNKITYNYSARFTIKTNINQIPENNSKMPEMPEIPENEENPETRLKINSEKSIITNIKYNIITSFIVMSLIYLFN